MPQEDREALRARAREFVESANFARHYEKLHMPARQWFVGQLIRCMTIVGLPGGIRGLLNFGNQTFATKWPATPVRALGGQRGLGHERGVRARG
jgi:hypothetical protein